MREMTWKVVTPAPVVHGIQPETAAAFRKLGLRRITEKEIHILRGMKAMADVAGFQCNSTCLNTLLCVAEDLGRDEYIQLED